MKHVYCHTDADGYCAASAIICLIDHEAQIHPVNYGWKVDFSMLKPEDTVYVVDYSFTPEQWAELFGRVPEPGVFWFDHHEEAVKQTYALYPELPPYLGRNGLSGCEMVWSHFLGTDEVPGFVQLVGDWDTWRWKQPGFEPSRANAVRWFQRGLSRRDIADMRMWQDLWGECQALDKITLLQLIIGDGQIIDEAFNQHYAVMWRTLGFNSTIGGIPCNVLNTRGNSLMFDGIPEGQRLPIQAGFTHDGETYRVQLFSDTEDVGEIARHYRGGGHKGAAGFQCRIWPFGVVERVYHKKG